MKALHSVKLSALRWIPVIATLCAALASHAGAETLSYTNSATAAGNSAYANIALNKFNTGLGSLDAVTVTVNFARLGGSFVVYSDTSDAVTVLDDPAPLGRVTVRQSTNNTLGFTQLGETNVAVTTVPAVPVEIPGLGTTTFAVTSQVVYTNIIQSIDPAFWTAYGSADGSGSVVFQIRNRPDITIEGGAYTLNSMPFTAEGNITVTYSYTIPEPSTYALLASGAAVLIAVRASRRRQRG